MKEINDKNFGLIIAFLLPGFLLLWLLSLSDIGNAEIGAWLKRFSDPSVSGFLYVALASLALGLIISAIRWAGARLVLVALLIVASVREGMFAIACVFGISIILIGVGLIANGFDES